MIERINIVDENGVVDRPKWLGLRRQDVTASVVGALSGLHPYTSRLKLYKEKQGADLGEVEVTVRMRRGLVLERAVAQIVMQDIPAWRITPAGVYLRDPERRIGATPDFFVESDGEFGLGVLQTKISTYKNFRREWMDDEGALMVPPWILLQVHTEMLLSETDWGAVGCFIDDPFNPLERDMFVFRVERHAKGEAKILADVAEFWDDVANGREPDVDAKLDGDLVKLLYPKSDELITVDLTGDNYLPGALAAREEAKARIKADQAFVEEVNTYLLGKMGDAELAFVSGFTVKARSYPVKPFMNPGGIRRPIHVKDVRPKEETASGQQIEF